MEMLLPLGRRFFAVAIIAFGLEHILHAGFVTRVSPPLPAWIPGHVPLAYALGLFLVLAGGALLLRRAARTMALLLGLVLLLSFMLLYLPAIAAFPRNGVLLTSAFKALAMAGGAFALARTFPRRGSLLDISDAAGGDAALLWMGRAFFGSFLIVAGILHFVYAPFVATLVPVWIPWHYFWTYFAGIALIAGGAGIMVPAVSFLAALLSGVMIFIWLIVLHIPRFLADVHDLNELTAVFEALAMSGIAFVLAASARRR